MSDSDDTDVLLLIPPDFFAVDSSDSEDSFSNHRDWFEGFGYVSSNSRVDDLINQVNDLEERINLIESKENLNSERYLSNHSHFNQAFDCAVSVDSTKFHNLGRSDLALRFYSMSSSGYRIGGESTDSGSIQCPINVRNHLSLPSSPNPSVGPSYFTNGNSRNVASFPAKRAIFLDTIAPQNVYTMSSTSDPHESSAYSVRSDMYNSDRIGNGILRYEWQDIDFLSEIDEFLEGRRKQSEGTSTSQPTTTSDEFCNVTSSENMQQIPNSNFGLHSFSNIPPNNSVIKPKVISPLQIQPTEKKSETMDLPQVGKLLSEIENTQKEIEYKLKYKGQLEGRDSSIPDNGNGHFEQVSERETNQFSSQNYGLYQFMNTGTQISHPVESSSVILPRVETQPPPSVSSNCTLNQDLSETYHSSNMPLNQSSAKFQNIGTIKEHAVSTSNQGAETYSESASTCNFDSNGKNPEVHHSFVQYPHAKSLTENDGSVRKQVSFETNKNLQETDPISSRELGFDFQDLKLDEKMTFEPKKLSSFGGDYVGLPVYSTFPTTQSVSKQNRSVEVEPPTEYTDSLEMNQHNSKKQIYEPTYNRPCNKRVEFTSQKDSAASQSEFRAGRSEASGDLPKVLPRAALTDSGHGLSVGTSSSSATNLLSLSDLWGSETKLIRNEHMTLEQRLEEEKYRRQHCEDLIRHLQGRLLEEQQRLAVAVRVDRGKDQAILQLQDAWAKLVSHWHELEERRHHLSGQLSAQRSIHQREMAEMAQKVKRYEQELSKVLDLAQGYKDKCDVAEQKRRESEEQHAAEIRGLESKIQEGQHLLAETGRHIEEMSQEIIELREKLKSAEEATLKEKQMLLKSQNEAKESSKKLNSLEADIAALREENNSLQLRLKEERSRSNLLEQQKKTSQASIEENKKREKSLRDELKEKTDMIEKVKLDLRDYYQEQVEAVVREKLQEFQTQLDNAEASLQREMEERDKAASEAAAKQVQHITDKHQLEVRLLEEKHKEELQLYKLQLSQATQQISQLQVRLQSYSNKKTEIVEKLQGVMEAQWKEALRIIGGSSPVVSSRVCHPHFLQSEKEKGDSVPTMQSTLQFLSTSQPNLEHHPASKSSQRYESHITNKTAPAAPFELPVRDVKNDRVPLLHVSQSSEGSSTADEMPFGKEGQLTYRVIQPSKSQSSHVGKDHDLQKYIKMLLNRSPGYPVDGSIAASSASTSTSVSERKLPPDWDRPEGKPHNKLSSHCLGDSSTSTFDASKSSQVSSKDGRSSKPPWK